MTKYALIINGDREQRHLNNVERSLRNVFEAEGYETYVASPEMPTTRPDRYVEPTLANVTTLIAELQKKIGSGDDLVIYTTGHGGKDNAAGSLCLADGCNYQTIAPLLDGIPYERRVVVGDQCYSGNWNALFRDPRTLFIAAGSKDETVCCQEMAERFWAPGSEIPDLNHDGQMVWQERYAYTQSAIHTSTTQYVPNPGYIADGTAPFAPNVITITSEEELTHQLARLTPGQYAIITFSAEWCTPCKQYKPQFEAMAEAGGGQHLWLRTENEAVATAWNIQGYPTVLIVDANGRRKHVENKNEVIAELALFEVSIEDWLKERLDEVAKAEQPSERIHAFRMMTKRLAASALGKSAAVLLERMIDAANSIENPADRVGVLLMITRRLAVDRVKVLNMAIDAAEQIPDPMSRAPALRGVASGFVSAGQQEAARAALEKASSAAEQIQDLWFRSFALREVASGFVSAGQQEAARAALEKANSTAELIKNPSERASVLREVASGFVSAGQQEAARAAFEKAISAAEQIKNPGERSFALVAIARELVAAGQQEAARAAFEKAISAAEQIPSLTPD